MVVTSLCPLRVTSVPWRMRNGGFALTVVCKGTFDLSPGELRLAEHQEDPNEDENFWDDDPHRSLQSPSDLALFKVRADVVLVGKAFAPKQAPARSLLARLTVAGVDKTIEVCADRSWTPDGGLREGAPFTSMPLRYERAAYGGENPVGVRVDAHAGGALPNLQPPGGGRRPDAIPPVGFGPIASQWPARRSLLGPLAASLLPRSWEEQPLPEDLDAAFFSVAPPDQRPERIEPGARLVLENLSPQTPRLVTTLPVARPRAFADRGKGLEELQLICDTLWIDTDSGVATLTWRGQMGLAGRHDEGAVVVLLDHPSRPLTWEEIQAEHAKAVTPAAPRRPLPPYKEADPTPAPNEEHTQAYRTSGARRDPALPFVGGRAPDVAAPPPPPPRAPVASAPPWLNVSPPPPAPSNPGETSAIRIGSSWAYEEPPAHSAAPLPPAPAPPPVLAPLPAPPPPVTVGVLAASNLAAAIVIAPVAEGAAVVPAPARTPARSPPAELIDLLWFDPEVPDRARLHRPWQDLIVRLRPQPDEGDPDEDPDEDPPEVKDRRDVLGLLAEGEPTPLEDLAAVLADAASPTGGLTPALVLVVGDLEPSFDEVEALSAALAAAAPFATGSDKKLKETFELVVESLKSPWAQGSARTAEALSTRLREAFPAGAWSLPPGWLDQQIERTLVEKRAYQKRRVLGKTLLRATLAQRGGAAVPTYLPDDLAGHLPLYARFQARLLAEVVLQQDQYEPHPYALRALALARVASPAKTAPKPASPQTLGSGRLRVT
jgi:hypothetical protein